MLLCGGCVSGPSVSDVFYRSDHKKERAVQIDSISVILSEDTDDYYQNFEKEWKRQLRICEVM